MRGRLPKHALAPGMVMDKTGTVGRCSNDVGIMGLPDGTHLAVSLFVKVRHPIWCTHAALLSRMCDYGFSLFGFCRRTVA